MFGVRTPVSLLREGFGLFSSVDMLLMLTLCFYSGFELSCVTHSHRPVSVGLNCDSFFAGEFPLLVGEKEGSKRVAEVNIVFGIAEVVGGLVVGQLSDKFPRKLITVFAMTVYSGGIVLSWLIRLHPTAAWAQFCAAAALGLGDASLYVPLFLVSEITIALMWCQVFYPIWVITNARSIISNTQIYASLGTLFPSDRKTVAAFTSFQFFQNIGSAAGFVRHTAHLPTGILLSLPHALTCI